MSIRTRELRAVGLGVDRVPVESGRMAISVGPLRANEERLYLEIVNSPIRGLAVDHYPSDAIDGWLVPVTDEAVDL